MLTSEAAIKAIIESVIKKSNHEPEQIATGPSENPSQPLLNPDHNLISGINLQDTGSAKGDLEDSPTEHYNSRLGTSGKTSGKPSGKTTAQTGEENANMGTLEEGGRGQICKDEKKKTGIQVDSSSFNFMLI